MPTLKAVVSGRVQGVGFRWFAQRQAEALGLRGWVRNTPEGSVELEACGDRPALERFLECLRRGPTMSRVDEVETHWMDGEADHRGFDIVS